MANSPHDHVHRLIRSMTRAEKRYFKVYTNRHIGGSGNHQALFDAIAAMEEYDEATLLAGFPEAGFRNRFAITKRRLYETILASLDLFHAESSVDARLRRSLHHVEILYRRALYLDAEKMLRSVRDLARKKDRQTILMEVLDWERRLMERTNYEGVKEAQLQELAEQARTVRDEWQEVDELWRLKSRSFMLLYRSGRVRDEERAVELRALLDHALLRADVMLGTAKARYLHHHIRSAVAFALNDLETCAEQLAANEALLTRESQHFLEEPHLLLSVMSNHTYVRLRLGRFTEATEGLKAFKRLPAMLPDSPSPDLEMKLFAMGTSLEMAVRCRLGEFDKAVARIPAMEEGIERYASSLSLVRRTGLWFQAAWACFGAGDGEQAARWCQRTLNEPGIDGLEETHAMARMLDLLILVDSGKRDLLPYALRNTERFLKGRKRVFRVERVLLRYLHDRMRTLRPVELVAVDRALCDALSELQNDPMERAVFDHFDPLAWAQGKVEERTLPDVMKGRVERSALPSSDRPPRKLRAA